jgi:hypothetical protein
MGLPRMASIPDSAEMLVARDLAVPMGPWLEALFADAWGTLALGPAYATGLRRTLGTAGRDAAITIHADEPGTYGPTPPPHLRLLLCCDLLAELGHRAEAQRQLALWSGRVGAVGEFHLPTRTGWAEVPADLLRAFGARVQGLIAGEPLVSLGGVSLSGLPGLRFSAADQTAAERAASSLGAGMQAMAGPRVLLAAAIMAADDAAGREGAVMAILRRSFAPAVAEPAWTGAAEPAAREVSVALGVPAVGASLARAPVAGGRAARPARTRPAVAAGDARAFVDLSPGALREAVIARAVFYR